MVTLPSPDMGQYLLQIKSDYADVQITDLEREEDVLRNQFAS